MAPDRLIARYPRFASYFMLGLATCMVFILGLAAIQQHQIRGVSAKAAREEAARIAQEKASRVAQVQSCYDRAQQGPGIQRILRGLEDLAENQITFLTGAPLVRAQEALQAARDFAASTAANTPTRRECRALAMSLGVAP